MTPRRGGRLRRAALVMLALATVAAGACRDESASSRSRLAELRGDRDAAAGGGSADDDGGERAGESGDGSSAAGPRPSGRRGDDAASGPAAGEIPVFPGETRVVRDDAERFELRLPVEWRDYRLDRETFEERLRAAADENPDLARVLDTQARSLLRRGGKLFAADPSSAGATNLNLIKLKATGASLDELARQSTRELAAVGATDIDQDRVRILAGRAVRATFKLSFALSNGSTIERHESQYYVLHAGTAYILTLSTDDIATHGAVLAAIAYHFDVL